MVFKTVKYFSISIDMEMVILKHLGEMCNSVVVNPEKVVDSQQAKDGCVT